MLDKKDLMVEAADCGRGKKCWAKEVDRLHEGKEGKGWEWKGIRIWEGNGCDICSFCKQIFIIRPLALWPQF